MTQLWRRYPLAITAVLALLVSLWLYWPTVRLPLIYDTLLHIRISGTLDWTSVWLPAKAFGFYRPLTFFPMLVIQRLFGYYPSRLLHGINVAQHAANAGLLVWLSWRLRQNGRFALTVGLLFALFPFSYQAVAVYGHNVHPTTVGIILLGLHSYLTALEKKRPFYWALTTILFVLSLLSHESAVLFGGFAALVQWHHDKKLPRIALSSLHPRHAPWLIFLLLGAFYLISYQFLPITRPPDAGQLNFNSLGLRVLYLLQAAVYPLAWLGNRLPLDNAPLLVLSGTAVVALWGIWACQKPQNRLPLLLGVGWWLAAYALIAVPLSTSYLLHGPRLLYLGSVGVAFFWATLLESVRPEQRQPVRLVGWLVMIAFVLVSSGIFVRDRLHAYAQLTSPITAVQSEMANRPETASILLINLPQFLDPKETTYPVGVEFVSMLGHYLFVEELIADNLNAHHPTWATAIPELLSAAPYNFAIHTQHTWDAVDFSGPELHVFLTTYPEQGPQTTHTGWIAAETAVPPPIANFSTYQLHAATATTCNNQVNIDLTWSAASEIPLGTTMFVQLLDANGQLIGQADGPLLGIRPDLFPDMSQKIIRDYRQIATGNQQPATIFVGVYNYFSGERETAVDAQNIPLPDNAWRTSVTPCP